MRKIDLPERWNKKIKSFLMENGVTNRDYLLAPDFQSNTIKLDFEDGSFVQFNYAILIEDSENKELGVFTEHCGYHLFNMDGLTIHFPNSVKDI